MANSILCGGALLLAALYITACTSKSAEDGPKLLTQEETLARSKKSAPDRSLLAMQLGSDVNYPPCSHDVILESDNSPTCILPDRWIHIAPSERPAFQSYDVRYDLDAKRKLSKITVYYRHDHYDRVLTEMVGKLGKPDAYNGAKAKGYYWTYADMEAYMSDGEVIQITAIDRPVRPVDGENARKL